jgi:uncharacterized alpha-E superfamily protein
MLLSRVADSLYWIGRYLERAEQVARVIDVRLDLGLDRQPGADGWDFSRLYASARLEPTTPPPANPSALVDALLFNVATRDSLMGCVTAARDNARQVREEISSDMWEQLNAMFLRLKESRAQSGWSARPHYLSRLVIEGVHLFAGVTDETMGHGEGWQYLQLGRYLERAAGTAALVDLHFRSEKLLPASHTEWVGLLRSCSALEAYCRCYTADLRPERIAEFLLLNSEFPRSVRFAAARIESALRAIAVLTARGASGRAERMAGRLHASLDFGQVDEILGEDPHAYLETVGHHCVQIHAAVYQSYVMYPIESALPA